MKRKSCLLIVLLLLVAVDVFASGSGMPWESPLTKILNSFTGPVAKVLGVLAILLTGCGIAFGEGGEGMKKIFKVVFGLSVAFTATSFGLSFFGYSGGVGF